MGRLGLHEGLAVMRRDELKQEIDMIEAEIKDIRECQARVAKLYPPDGWGHGMKWEKSLKKAEVYRAELRGVLRALEDGAEQHEEVYSDQNFEATCRVIIPDFGQISLELIEHFSRNPDHLHQLDWRKFEQLLEAVFRNQGYVTVLGPGSADDGIDLRLIQKDSIGAIVTLVQAKKYAANRPIHLEAVQALSAVVDDTKANRGLFVTTSRFLPSARQFAERQSRRLILATSGDVGEWCKQVAAQRTLKEGSPNNALHPAAAKLTQRDRG